MPRNQLEVTAYHEAGHAVTAFLVRRPIRKISIIPDAHSYGACFAATAPPLIPPDRPINWHRLRRVIEREVLILLAGDNAALIHNGKRQPYGWSDELQLAWDKLEYLTGYNVFPDTFPAWKPWEEQRTYLRWLDARSWNMLAYPRHWPAVEAIARRLLDRGQISGVQARRLFNEVIHGIPEA